MITIGKQRVTVHYVVAAVGRTLHLVGTRKVDVISRLEMPYQGPEAALEIGGRQVSEAIELMAEGQLAAQDRGDVPTGLGNGTRKDDLLPLLAPPINEAIQRPPQ